MAVKLHAVEFLGGPFDGFVRDVWVSPENLPPFAALPVNASAIASPARVPSTSPGAWGVAYYELQHRGGSWHYCFLSVVRKSQKGPTGWLRRTVLRLKRWANSWGN
jgi:hypothetical protein